MTHRGHCVHSVFPDLSSYSSSTLSGPRHPLTMAVEDAYYTHPLTNATPGPNSADTFPEGVDLERALDPFTAFMDQYDTLAKPRPPQTFLPPIPQKMAVQVCGS